jgi:hypothetical protein
MPEQKNKLSLGEMLDLAEKSKREEMDAKLEDVPPAFKLSEIRKIDKRVSWIMTPIGLFWVVSIIGLLMLADPIIKHHWSLKLIAFLVIFIASTTIFFVTWAKVLRYWGLYCPHCNTTFMYAKTPVNRHHADPKEQYEKDRRCSKCQAVIFDLDA